MKNPLFSVKNESGKEVSIICWSPEIATISASHNPAFALPSAAVAITKNMAKQIAEHLLSWVNDTQE